MSLFLFFSWGGGTFFGGFQGQLEGKPPFLRSPKKNMDLFAESTRCALGFPGRSAGSDRDGLAIALGLAGLRKSTPAGWGSGGAGVGAVSSCPFEPSKEDALQRNLNIDFGPTLLDMHALCKESLVRRSVLYNWPALLAESTQPARSFTVFCEILPATSVESPTPLERSQRWAWM